MEQQAQHRDGMHHATPGPWKVGQPAHDPQAWDVQTEAGVEVARLPWRQKANAQLIAAAPELLAALEGVLRVADRKTDEFDAARAAIAKARGEA